MPRPESPDVGGRHPRGQLGILTKGTGHARPARLGGQVGHRVKSSANPHRQVLTAGDVTETLHECFIPGRGQPERIRPL